MYWLTKKEIISDFLLSVKMCKQYKTSEKLISATSSCKGSNNNDHLDRVTETKTAQ